jgi:hypothetical protein
LFLGAITIFLAGSALCGQSRNMAELIGFRAVQGIGGGGAGAPVAAVQQPGVTPTVSGVYLLPMVLGMLLTSIGSGQLITRTGRYKVYPNSVDYADLRRGPRPARRRGGPLPDGLRADGRKVS